MKNSSLFKQCSESYYSIMALGIFTTEYNGQSFSKMTEEECADVLEKQILLLDRGVHGTIRDMEEIKKIVSDETILLYLYLHQDRSFSAQKKDDVFVTVHVPIDGKENTYHLTRCDKNGNPILDADGRTDEWEIAIEDFRDKYLIRNDGIAFPKQDENIILRADRDFTLYKNWGEQKVKAGDYLNITNPNDIYGIGESKFLEMYQIFSVNINKETEEKRIAEYREVHKGEIPYYNVFYPDYTETVTEGAILCNAHSTKEFLDFVEKNQGKVLEGKQTNVDFKKVEDYILIKGLVFPELGFSKMEHCDFRGCEIVKPTSTLTLVNGSKSDETELIGVQISELQGFNDLTVWVDCYPTDDGESDFEISVIDSIDGDDHLVFEFISSKSPFFVDYKTICMNNLQNKLREIEKELLDFTINTYVDDYVKKQREHILNVFYQNIDINKKIRFSDKEEAIRFADFMSKRTENMAKEKFCDLEEEWKEESREFLLLSEIMRLENYDLNTCEIMVNHPDFLTQQFLKTQRNAWVHKNALEMQSVISQIKKTEKSMAEKIKQREERLGGIGKYWEKIVNNDEFARMKNKLKQVRKDRENKEAVFKRFIENEYAYGNEEFDKKLMQTFRNR